MDCEKKRLKWNQCPSASTCCVHFRSLFQPTRKSREERQNKFENQDWSWPRLLIFDRLFRSNILAQEFPVCLSVFQRTVKELLEYLWGKNKRKNKVLWSVNQLKSKSKLFHARAQNSIAFHGFPLLLGKVSLLASWQHWCHRNPAVSALARGLCPLIRLAFWSPDPPTSYFTPTGFFVMFFHWLEYLPSLIFLKLVPQGSSLNVSFLNASYDTLLPNLNPINFPLSGFLLGPHFLAPEPDKNVDSINRQ